MNNKAIITSLIIAIMLSLTAIKGDALDYPHFGGNYIGCNACHFVYGTQPSLLPPWTAHTPQDIDDTQHNTLCWSCHNDIEAPYVRTHSSLQTDNGYGDWTIECKTCHNPHYQKQADTYGSAGYLYSGTSTNVTATTLAKTGAGWTTNQYQELVVIPNTAQNKYKYKIVSNTADTLTIGSPVDLSKVSAGNTFAIVYGKLIDSTITTPNSGSRTVKFFKNTGTNSFADGDGTYDGVCEVCHTQTIYHRNDASGNHTHNAGKCTICHQHSEGFKGSGCDVCHGYPPKINTATGGPDGLVNNPGVTGSATAGAHDKHVNTKIYPCEYCHYNSSGSGPAHNDGAPQDITIGFSLFGRAYTGGIYDGQTTAHYDSSEINTTVIDPGSGSNTCSNIYCHGELLNGTKWGNGVNTTPAWDAAGVDCGDCHLATNANPPTLGSHEKHTGDTAPDLNLSCTLCHSGYANKHADSQVNVAFASDGRVSGGSYSGTAAMFDSYGQCSNIYCHSNVQNNTGTGGPTSYANPVWGSGALTCASCHAYPPNTGTHLMHINSNHHGLQSYTALTCDTCHYGNTHANGSIEVSSNSMWVTNFSYNSGGPPGNGYGFCAGACHAGAIWNGPAIYCYDCHQGEIDKLINYPAPTAQTAPAIIPEPDVISPTDAAVTLEWQPAPSAAGPPSFTEYYVEADDDPAFNNPDYHSAWITATSWTVTVRTATTWHWRVRARDAVRPDIQLASQWQIDSFSVISPGSPPAPALIPEPDFDSGGVPRNITLQWGVVIDPDGDPVEYYVEVSLQNNFSVPALVSGWISGTDFTFSASCSGMYWRVRARDSVSGAVSQWSSIDYFQDVFNCGGSCPFLYVWDGARYDFGTDLNGPGKLAAKSSSGYFKPGPDDYYILGTDPVEKDGHYEMRLVEERFEVNYLDMLKLYTVDIPDNRDVYAEKPNFDTSFNGLLQELHTVDKNLNSPLSVIQVNTGQEVSDATRSSDGNHIILSNDRNLDFEYHTLELDLGDLSQAPRIKLVIDGLTAFPTTPDGVARSQQFGPRTKIEVPDGNGQWVSVPKTKAVLPKLPEFRRPFVLDISDIFLTGIYKVRLTFLFKTYVDSIYFDTTADEAIILTEVPLFSAELRSYGHSEKLFLLDEIYEYVYNSDAPNHQHEYFPGNYTRHGGVDNLLSGIDDFFVIYGSGDEIALKFNPAGVKPAGFTRKFLMYTNGYYKDGKVDVTRTVEPLPFAAMSNFPYDPAVEHYPDDDQHNQYLVEYNTRSQ